MDEQALAQALPPGSAQRAQAKTCIFQLLLGRGLTVHVSAAARGLRSNCSDLHADRAPAHRVVLGARPMPSPHWFAAAVKLSSVSF